MAIVAHWRGTTYSLYGATLQALALTGSWNLLAWGLGGGVVGRNAQQDLSLQDLALQLGKFLFLNVHFGLVGYKYTVYSQT